MKTTLWIRHAAAAAVVVTGAWHGMETGSRGAFVAAGAAALGWFVWPEAARLLAWRRERRTRKARQSAERWTARAERARIRADRRPGSRRRRERADRLAGKAQLAVDRATRAQERARKLDTKPKEDRSQ